MQAEEPYPWGVADFRWAWLTTAMLGAFILVYAVERHHAQLVGQPVGVDYGTLTALGGVSRSLVLGGEPYRLLSAPFLHKDLGHLLGNGLTFALAGWALERLLGRAWMFCVFALGALAGSVASIACNPPELVSVGASGAIMAILATLIVTSFRMPPGRRRARVLRRSVTVAAFSLIPLGRAALHVDYAAHAGGALLGLVLGLLLLGTWPLDEPMPSFRRAAAAAAALTAIGFGLGGYAVARHYPYAAATATLIPPGQLPHGNAEIAAQADALLARYPNDPRAHLLEASAMTRRSDPLGAERELRRGLALVEASPHLFAPVLASVLRVTLAVAELDLGRPEEARGIAEPACLARDDAAPPPPLAAILVQDRLCAAAAP